MTLDGTLDEVEEALTSLNRKACVVWPATAAGDFVGAFQVLTEKEWQRLQRDGLRLAPGVDVRDLYCFQNVPAYDGLTIRVYRLVQESQIHTRQNEWEVWKVQKMPVMIRTRAQLENQFVIARNGREILRSNSSAEDTPPQSVNVVRLETISPEEVKRKKRRSADVGNLEGSKCVVDDVRPPTKTRRLDDSSKEISTTADPIVLPEIHTRVASRDTSRHAARTHRNNTIDETTGLIPVVEGSNSSGYSSEAVDNEGNTISENSDGVQSDEEILEQDSTAVSSPIRRTETRSGRNDRRKQETLNLALQRVIAAGMCIDDEDRGNCTSHSRAQSSSVTNLFEPLWSIWESATTQVHNVLNKVCALSSNIDVITAQDSMDYDLLWVEEGGDQQRWTMFGEPSTSGPIGEN